MNIIVYDKENIKYFNGKSTEISVEHHYMDYRGVDVVSTYFPLNNQYTFIAQNVSETKAIELDETLMRRIAKYNKDQELKQIDEQIEKKKQELKALEDLIEDRDKRVKKLKEFVANLYDLELEDEEEYEGW